MPTLTDGIRAFHAHNGPVSGWRAALPASLLPFLTPNQPKHECLSFKPEGLGHLIDPTWETDCGEWMGHSILTETQLPWTCEEFRCGVPATWGSCWNVMVCTLQITHLPGHSPCRAQLHFTGIAYLFMNNEGQIVLFLNTTLTLKELEIQPWSCELRLQISHWEHYMSGNPIKYIILQISKSS
jgi:hypothetical protein